MCARWSLISLYGRTSETLMEITKNEGAGRSRCPQPANPNNPSDRSPARSYIDATKNLGGVSPQFGRGGRAKLGPLCGALERCSSVAASANAVFMRRHSNNPSIQLDSANNFHYHYSRGDAGWISAFEAANANNVRRIYFPKVRGTPGNFRVSSR